MHEGDPCAALLLLTASGDQRAFEQLYRKTSGRMFGLCQRLLGKSALAEEVLQESYLKVWSRAGTFDASKARSTTWIATIVRNSALDVIRAHNSRPIEVDSEYEGEEFAALESGPLEVAHLSGATAAVMTCMEQLDKAQKKAVLMAYYYGHSHDEIASLLDSPLGTVKAWIRRGIEKVKLCLE